MQGSAPLPRLLVQVPAGRRGGRGQRVTGRRPRLPGLPRQGADVSRREARPPAPLGVTPSSCTVGGPAPAPLRGWRGAPLTEAARELTATAEQAKEAAGQLCAPGQGPRGHRLPVALDHRVPATPPLHPPVPRGCRKPERLARPVSQEGGEVSHLMDAFSRTGKSAGRPGSAAEC